nr:uncharacterized protein LOC108066816 [Drosophila takahashii]
MWDRENTIKLIELYENYSVLWDVSSADYRNKHKKQNAFHEMAKKLDKSDDEIKTKIHHLRTQFLQEVRRVKKKKSGQGTSGNYTSKWEFFDALKFIKNDDGNNFKIQNLELIESAVNTISSEEAPCPTNSSLTTDDVPSIYIQQPYSQECKKETSEDDMNYL